MDHWGAIAHYIVLALEKHRNEDKILIFTGEDKEKWEILERLRKSKIFQTVIIDTEIKHPGAKLIEKKEINYAIESAIDKLFNNNNINFAQVSEIYSATDIDGVFRYYLALKKINYTYLMIDYLDIYNPYKNIGLFKTGVASNEYMDILNNSHVYDGLSKYCTKIIGFPNTEAKNEQIKKKLIRLDIKKELDKIPMDDACTILSCFGETIENLDKIKCILLSNSEGFLWAPIDESGYVGRNRKEQVLLYQELLDFYSKKESNSIMIKPHPNNFLDWEKYFKGIHVLNKNIPIEFVRFSKECFIEEVIAIQTSALDKIKDKISKEIVATFDYAKYYHLLCSLYVICSVYKNSKTSMPLQEFGMTEKFFKAFLQQVCLLPISEDFLFNKAYDKTCFKIYKDLSVMDTFDAYRFIRAMDNDSALAVINVSLDIPLYRLKNIPNIFTLVFRVQKDPIKSEVLLPLDDEYIIIFTKSFELKEKLKRETVDKSLQVTGVQLHAEALSEFAKERYFQEFYRKNELYAIEKYMDVLTEFIKRGSVYSLKNIIDFEAYLASLRLIKDAVILISVKDNAGKNFTYAAVKYWKALGLKTDIDI